MKKQKEPATLRVLRALLAADGPLTRAQLFAKTRMHPATEITRPLRDLRKPHPTWSALVAGDKAAAAVLRRGLAVPQTPDADGRPAYSLTSMDRYAAAALITAMEASR